MTEQKQEQAPAENAEDLNELREVQHTDAYHRVNDREAMRLQLQHLDAMRRCGAL